MEEKTITLNGISRTTDCPLADEIGRHIDRSLLDSCHLKLDLQNVAYLSSMDIGTLISLHKTSLASGGKLTLLNANDDVREVIGVCKLNKYLNLE
jgi:anti-anti-sigma factor